MSEAEVTPWFRWPAKPVRVGEYDFRGNGWPTRGRLHWNGRAFGYFYNGMFIELADDESDEWRGLTKPAATGADK